MDDKKEKLRQLRQEVFSINTDLADLNKRILIATANLLELDKVIVEELDKE